MIEAEAAYLPAEVEVDKARFDDGKAVDSVDLEDAAHPRSDDDNAALTRECAPGEAGAGSAGNTGNPAARAILTTAATCSAPSGRTTTEG